MRSGLKKFNGCVGHSPADRHILLTQVRREFCRSLLPP